VLGQAFCWTLPWEAVGWVIETGQHRTGQYRIVLPEPGALMPAFNANSMPALLDIECGVSPAAMLSARANVGLLTVP